MQAKYNNNNNKWKKQETVVLKNFFPVINFISSINFFYTCIYCGQLNELISLIVEFRIWNNYFFDFKSIAVLLYANIELSKINSLDVPNQSIQFSNFYIESGILEGIKIEWSANCNLTK